MGTEACCRLQPVEWVYGLGLQGIGFLGFRERFGAESDTNPLLTKKFQAGPAKFRSPRQSAWQCRKIRVSGCRVFHRYVHLFFLRLWSFNFRGGCKTIA